MAKLELKNKVIGVTLEISVEELKILTLSLGKMSDNKLEEAWTQNNYSGVAPKDVSYNLFEILSDASREAMKGEVG